jgi:hypothetical protein
MTICKRQAGKSRGQSALDQTGRQRASAHGGLAYFPHD